MKIPPDAAVWFWLKAATVAIAAGCSLVPCDLSGANEPPAHLGPMEALSSFEVAGGLTVELVAAEPLVASPCAMVFDERSRLFVAENRGYPSTAEPPQGLIALLEDTDGDGTMDKRTVFADALTFPNGVMPWRGGLFVTCAPDLLYFKDNDGDGRADERRVVLTGFDTKGSTQLRVNAPTLGPDGWVYLASGLSGGRITNPSHPEFAAVEMKSDLRFEPHSGRFEPTDGRSQYGQSFDNAGRRFICMNRIQVQHVVLSTRHLLRNPHLAFSETVQNCPELVPNPLLRGGGGAARIFPISKNITTADSHAGTFSAACALHLWRGGGLPEEYDGCAFSCDPTGNLVHVDKLEPRGATFAAVPLFNGREFLASRDDWFRPVFLATGPDGALYVCDMYRQVIEHPDYLPEDIRRRTEFAAGKEMGRIWRVRKKDAAAAMGVKRETSAPPALLENLFDSNSWVRDVSFRLFVEEPATIPLPVLATLFEQRKNSPPAVSLLRLVALAAARGSTLQQGGSAEGSPADVATELLRSMTRAAYESVASDVRAAALRVLPFSPDAGSFPQDLLNDPDPAVRFDLALHPDLLTTPGADGALWKIASQGADDRWTRAAVLSQPSADLFPWVISNFVPGKDHEAEWTEDHLTFLSDAARIAGSGDRAGKSLLDPEMVAVKADPGGFDVTAAAVAGYLEGAQSRLTAKGEKLERLRDEASDVAGDLRAPAPRRIRAIRLLARAPWEIAHDPLMRAALDSNVTVSTSALQALAGFDEREAAASLLDGERWIGWSPVQRETILAMLVAKPVHLGALLAAIEAGAVPVLAIDRTRRQQFITHADPALRQRAEKLFPAAPAGDRKKAYEDARAALGLQPLPGRGREVFHNACAMCHRLDREGVAVGPDLFDIRNQPKEGILLHIVAPEQEIAPGFAAYSVELRDGRSLSGIIVSENANSVTLRQGGGVDEAIPRENIRSLEASSLSLMPQGLEAAMSLQDLADLLAYLKGEQ